MSQYGYRPDYKRHLPHFQPPGASLFVTFRLADSIPKVVLERLKREAEARQRILKETSDPAERDRLLYEESKRQFGRFDEILDKATTGPFWLRQPEIAAILAEAFHYRHGKVYDLDAFCIMSNHAHVVFTPLEKEGDGWYALQKIMHSLKRNTARKANLLLRREGAFWQGESYDHVIRDRQEWERIVKYVLNNPVKAGLAANWEDWPWTYLKTL
jgi:putative transposase